MTITVEFYVNGEKERLELDGPSVGYQVKPDHVRVFKNDGDKKTTHVFVNIPCHIEQSSTD